MKTFLDSALCLEILGLPDTTEFIYAKFASTKLKQKNISEDIIGGLPDLNVLRGNHFNDSPINRFKNAGGNILIALNKTGSPTWSFGALVTDSSTFKKEFSKMVIAKNAVAVTKRFLDCKPSGTKHFKYDDYLVDRGIVKPDIRDAQLYLCSCMTQEVTSADFQYKNMLPDNRTDDQRDITMSSEDAIALIIRCLS